jgi:hypothetical protein
VWDHRNFGASDGEPRQEIDPWAQVRDYRDAINYACRRPEVDADPMAPSALPTPDSWEWFSETGRTRAPAWRNEVTLRSVEMFWEYEPGADIQWVSPTPFLMVVAAGDHLTVSDLAIEAYGRALEPKRLVVLQGGHFGASTTSFDAASGAAADWFAEHLGA